MKHTTRLFIGIAVVIVALVAGGAAIKNNGMSINSQGGMNQTDTSRAVATNAVAIKDYMFSPMVVKVKVGTTVTWTNKDAVHHSVTRDTARADAPNGPLISLNQTYSFKFQKAGTYTFHCMEHPDMHGTVIVTSS